MNKQKNIFLISVLGLTILILTGCTSINQQIQEKATEKMIEGLSNGQLKVDLDENKTTVETSAGTGQVGENIEVPSDFPSDVYVIDGIVKTSYQNAGNNGWTLSIQTDKSVTEVSNLYQERLNDQGWKKDSFLDLGGTITLGYSKEKRTVSLMINTDPTSGKTMIIIGTSKNN